MKVLYFYSAGLEKQQPSRHLMEAMVEDTLDAGMAVHMIASRSSGVLPEVPEHLVNRDDFTHVLVARRSVAKLALPSDSCLE